MRRSSGVDQGMNFYRATQVNYLSTKARLGLDGATFYFANWSRGKGSLAGRTWSPEAKSKMWDLVDLGNQLVAYGRAESKTQNSGDETIAKNAQILLKRFDGESAAVGK